MLISADLVDDGALDRELVTKTLAGDARAVEELVRRHQPWLLHMAQRMLWNRNDAEDAAQEILIKAVRNLAGFRQESQFRTWLYRIAANHLIDRGKRTKAFDQVAQSLSAMPDVDLPDDREATEQALFVEEAKIACTTGMLLCLQPRQRIAFIVGEIFGVDNEVGAEVLETTPANFRQILSRTRRELYAFMNRRCGLVNAANPCRCARKATAFAANGWAQPGRLQFTDARLVAVREVAPDRSRELEDLSRRHAEVFRDQPIVEPRAQAALLRALLDDEGLTWVTTS